jgi:hypothetical protein
MAKEKKMLELWEGYEVEVNEDLLDDVDYISDLGKAANNNDFAEVITIYFALVGGEKTYKDARDYLTEKYGHFSIKGLKEITEKIEALFPKDGNRAQRRTWQTSK